MVSSCYIIWFCHEHHTNTFIINRMFPVAVCSVCCLILPAHFIVNQMKTLIYETYFHISASRALSFLMKTQTEKYRQYHFQLRKIIPSPCLIETSRKYIYIYIYIYCTITVCTHTQYQLPPRVSL